MSFLLKKNISISFYLILLLIICNVSFQASHPKTLHFAYNKSMKKLQPLITEGRLATMVQISWDKPGTESMKLSSTNQAENHRETLKSKRSNKYKKKKKQQKRSVENFKKVSWRLPHDHHKKLKDSDGVFDADYEQARTHPPSHN